MDESKALFMAQRIMERNIERAEDALTVADNTDLLLAIMLECKSWLQDYTLPATPRTDSAGA